MNATMYFFNSKFTGPASCIVPLYLFAWYCFLVNAAKLITIGLTWQNEKVGELIVRAFGLFFPISSILIEPASWFV